MTRQSSCRAPHTTLNAPSGALQACASPSWMAGRYVAGKQTFERLGVCGVSGACLLDTSARARPVQLLFGCAGLHHHPGFCRCCCRFMAYDRHMNLVLGDAEEFRKLPPKKGAKEEVRSARPGFNKHTQPLRSPVLSTVSANLPLHALMCRRSN